MRNRDGCFFQIQPASSNKKNIDIGTEKTEDHHDDSEWQCMQVLSYTQL